MAAASGRTTSPLIDRLLAEPYRFSFFQAVRLLERQQPDSVGLGRQGPPSQEAVVLQVDPSLGFPKSDITAIESLDTGHAPPYRLVVAFLGLHGASSPLPTFYAEEVLHDLQASGILGAFLDVFHHRLLSLFYRSWLRFRHHMLFAPGGGDEFSRAIFCLAGLGEPGLRDSAGLPAVRMLRFVGLITQKPHSAAALSGILQDYFGVPVQITQGMGRWVVIRPNQQASLGIGNCVLGDNLCLGKRIWDRLSKFRVTLGPLDFNAYARFLPGSEDHKTLKQVVKLFAPDMLDFDLELVLNADQAPRLGLDTSGKSRLGWTTGFFTGRAVQDVQVAFR